MNYSLSSFLYFNYSLKECIRRMATIGYDAIDVWGGRPHAYRKDLRDYEINDTRKMLDSFGMKVASFIPAQFRYPTSLCCPNEVIRRDSILYIKDSIETAVRLGAPIVSVCPGHTLDDQGFESGWDLLADSLSDICQFSKNYPLKIAIEPADKFETDLIQTTSQAMKMVNDLGYENLGVLFDNGHAYVVGEDTSQAIRNLGDKLFHIHIDDNNGQRDQHLIPGHGTYDFIPFIKALNEIRYDGFLSAELGWDYTIDPDSAAVETYKFISQLYK